MPNQDYPGRPMRKINRSDPKCERTRPDRVVLVGASVRAAVDSIRRVDPEVTIVAVDAFGDLQTLRHANTWIDAGRAEQLTSILDPLAATIPSAVLRVGGGVGPAIERLRRAMIDRPSMGSIVSLAEDPSPETLRRWVDAAGLAMPPMATDPPNVAGWIVKSPGGSGGIGIRQHDPNTASTAPIRASRRCGDTYYQQRVPGEPVGVVYSVVNRQPRLIGLTKNLTIPIGEEPFRYAGSVGPIDADGYDLQALDRLANRATQEIAPMRCFNIDVVIDGSKIWVLEINARYSASMEIFERLQNRSMLWHEPGSAPEPMLGGDRQMSKRVLYADRDTVFQAAETNRRYAKADVTDTPRDGTVVPAGHPMCTIIEPS